MATTILNIHTDEEINMKEAHIPYIITETAIDWNLIPRLDIDQLVLTDSTDVTAYAQICHSDTALFLHLSATETEIRSQEKDLLGQPCKDSCLEFFFCPKEGDNRYFNFEFNPATCLFLGFGPNVHDLTRLLPNSPDFIDSIFHPSVTFRDDGWDIMYQIPYTFIRRFFPDFTPAQGQTIRANFYKCADLAAKPHYLAWNPITGTEGSVFHAPEDFGLLYFD